MAQLVLIRHSRVQPDAGVPASEWPLTEEGRALCRALASSLRPLNLAHLYSSTETKAMQTAELVASRLRISWETAPGLEEHRRPYVPDPDEFMRLLERFFATPGERVFGEESSNEVRARLEDATRRLMAQHPGETIGVVTHGTVIAAYAAPLFGIGAAALWFRLQQPAFLVVDPETGTGLRIVDEIE